ncbi:MAG: hypothetical protein RIS80_1301, partial [Actinomycetota bacterium]
PVCRDYLSAAQTGKPANYSYLGPVFRFRAGTASEQYQAGLESFGRTDREAADADDFELQQYLHLHALNRGILMTPFHNMALMSPAHTLEDVKRHTEHFRDAVQALFA